MKSFLNRIDFGGQAMRFFFSAVCGNNSIDDLLLSDLARYQAEKNTISFADCVKSMTTCFQPAGVPDAEQGVFWSSWSGIAFLWSAVKILHPIPSGFCPASVYPGKDRVW